jgi:tRNA nucleotidyltransferase (CCA-adding enzyme)
MDEIFIEVLKQIIPTMQELVLIDNITKLLKKLLEKKAEELNVSYTSIEPQGSTGIKQTQLRNDFDIDLFIGLNYDEYSPNYVGLSKNKLKKKSKKDFLKLCNNWIIKSLTLNEFKNPQLLYAEHPYVTVDYVADNDTKLKIDIVLYFDLDLEYIKKNGPITAVDRSPWHGRFVKDNLNEDQKNDVRLLKQFFKACHSYGDKSAVGKIGFIGYAAELLIYHYETLSNLFKNFDKLKNTPIDYYKRTKDQLYEVTHFKEDYLIITDPIDMNRNVASAISKKAYIYCNYKIKEFIKNPKMKYFQIYDIPKANLTNTSDAKLSNIFIVETKNTDQKVHYTISRDKLYSLGDSIVANGEQEFSHAERFGKIIFEVFFDDLIGEYNLAVYCSKPEISPTYPRRGPPIENKYHADKFKRKNKNYSIKSGYLWTETRREYSKFLDFLIDFVLKGIAENLEIINISQSYDCKTVTGKQTIYLLLNMILPFAL